MFVHDDVLALTLASANFVVSRIHIDLFAHVPWPYKFIASPALSAPLIPRRWPAALSGTRGVLAPGPWSLHVY